MILPVDKAYQNLLKRILDEGKEKGDRTGTGTISIFSHKLEIDMSDGFPLLTTKKMFTKGIIYELLWFLNGDTNIKYLVDNGVNIWTPDAFREYYKQSNSFKGDWPDDIESFKERIKSDDEFAKKWGELGPVYGKQWVNWGGYMKTKSVPSQTSMFNDEFSYPIEGINQIQQAVDALNNNPDSRRIMVSAWNPGEIDKMALPPCHWAFELYTEELDLDERIKHYKDSHPGNLMKDMIDKSTYDHKYFDGFGWPKRRLSLKWHQRSVDFGLGLPFNIASYGLLLEMFAQQCNMIPGILIGDLTNVHIYKNHINIIKEQLTREPYQLPMLHLNKSNNIFSYNYNDFTIKNYKSHPILKMNLSV